MKRFPIGVMDSGVGGVSVLAALTDQLPEESFLYFADFANVPYGTKSVEEIRICVEAAVDALLNRGIKALVIACNTATSAAAATLRAKLALPIIGMEPALKPAAALRKGGRVLVLATPATLALPKFQTLMTRYGEGAIPLPCPGLMELVETMDWPGAEAYLRRELAAYAHQQIDALVLGCTHYSFLRPMLCRMIAPATALVDGNAGTAAQLHRVLAEQGILTDAPSPVLSWMHSGQEPGAADRLAAFYRLVKGDFFA